MTPDRIRTFIYRPPPMGRVVSLLADQGLGTTLVVVTYTREECEASSEPNGGHPDLVEEIQAAATDYCDSIGEPARFVLAWFNADNRQIKSSPHSAVPSSERKGHATEGSTITVGEPMSATRIVSELLAALQKKDAAMSTSFGVVLLAYEKALKMQQGTIDTLDKLVRSLGEEAEKGRKPAARSEDEIQAELRTAELKQAALAKLIDLGPDLARIAIRVAWKEAGFTGDPTDVGRQ